MPVYDYECEHGHVFEYWQDIKDEHIKTCPFNEDAGEVLSPDSDLEPCNAPVKRLISSTSFVLKGKGWFKDGY